MKKKLIVDFDEYNKVKKVRYFEIVKELPEIGDPWESTCEVIGIEPVWLDFENGNEYEAYKVLHINRGCDDERDNPFESYIAIEKEKIRPIREIRMKTGLTQKEFAKKYHIPERTLSNWEVPEESSNYRECPEYVIELLKQIIEKDEGNIDTVFVMNKEKDEIFYEYADVWINRNRKEIVIVTDRMWEEWEKLEHRAFQDPEEWECIHKYNKINKVKAL